MSRLSTKLFLLLVLFVVLLGTAEVLVVAADEWASSLLLFYLLVMGCMLALFMWMTGILDMSSPRKMQIVRVRDRWFELSLRHRIIFCLIYPFLAILFVLSTIYFPDRPSFILILIFAIYLPIIIYFGERPLFPKR